MEEGKRIMGFLKKLKEWLRRRKDPLTWKHRGKPIAHVTNIEFIPGGIKVCCKKGED